MQDKAVMEFQLDLQKRRGAIEKKILALKAEIRELIKQNDAHREKVWLTENIKTFLAIALHPMGHDRTVYAMMNHGNNCNILHNLLRQAYESGYFDKEYIWKEADKHMEHSITGCFRYNCEHPNERQSRYFDLILNISNTEITTNNHKIAVLKDAAMAHRVELNVLITRLHNYKREQPTGVTLPLIFSSTIRNLETYRPAPLKTGVMLPVKKPRHSLII